MRLSRGLARLPRGQTRNRLCILKSKMKMSLNKEPRGLWADSAFTCATPMPQIAQRSLSGLINNNDGKQQDLKRQTSNMTCWKREKELREVERGQREIKAVCLQEFRWVKLNVWLFVFIKTAWTCCRFYSWPSWPETLLFTLFEKRIFDRFMFFNDIYWDQTLHRHCDKHPESREDLRDLNSPS